MRRRELAHERHVRFGLILERRDVAVAAIGRQADPGSLATNRGGDRVECLEREAQTVFDGATAIPVVAGVERSVDELIEQVSIGGVYLDAIETGRDDVARRLHEFASHAGISSVLNARGLLWGRYAGLPSASIANVTEFCACRSTELTGGWPPTMLVCVDRPACLTWPKITPPFACTASVTRRQEIDLLLREDARRKTPAMSFDADAETSRDDEARPGPLREVQSCVGVSGHACVTGTGALHRRHDEAIAQTKGPIWQGSKSEGMGAISE